MGRRLLLIKFSLLLFCRCLPLSADTIPCFALRLHRDTPQHVLLPSDVSKLVLSQGHGWTIHVWVKFLEGRPGVIVSPVLDLINTPLGMRLRGCANLISGWSCVTPRKLWFDDGEWHLITVSSIGENVSLYLDGQNIGKTLEIDSSIRITPRLMLGFDGNPKTTSTSLLVKNLVVSTHNIPFEMRQAPNGYCSWPHDISSKYDEYRSLIFWPLNGTFQGVYPSLSPLLELKNNNRQIKETQEQCWVFVKDQGVQMTQDKNTNNVDALAMHGEEEQEEERVSTLIEIHVSKSPETPRSAPLTVIYYSSDQKWDAYWELYHHWLVGVLLKDVMLSRQVRVVLDRCAPPCTLSTLTLMSNSLVVINAHSSPNLDPGEVADEAFRRGLENLALFHTNHEQPWIKLEENPSDWRNGYMEGHIGLANSYRKWQLVLRQHHYLPLSQQLTEEPPSPHFGYLYIPLGPAYDVIAAGFDKLDSLKSTSSSVITPLVNGLVVENGETSTQKVATSYRGELCYFAGAAAQYGGTDDRTAMLQVLANSLKDLCKVFISSQPIDPDVPAGQMFPRPNYYSHMLNTKFALCPAGNSYETFRHWEALQAGSIPISALPKNHHHAFAQLWCRNVSVVLSHFSLSDQACDRDALWWLDYAMKAACPVIFLPSWKELPSLIKAFAMGGNDTDLILDKIQLVVLRRAEFVKRNTANDIAMKFHQIFPTAQFSLNQ